MTGALTAPLGSVRFKALSSIVSGKRGLPSDARQIRPIIYYLEKIPPTSILSIIHRWQDFRAYGKNKTKCELNLLRVSHLLSLRYS